MSTVIRAEVSEKSKYWISKHRYYELKHFCLQYPTWKKMYKIAEGTIKSVNIEQIEKNGEHGDLTSKCAMARAYFSTRIDMIDEAAKEADESLAEYIIKGVTEGYSYPYLKTYMNIPCGKDTYYDRYRKFFYILSKARE